jgi:transcriptional regulator with XRE-family HTH domain
MSIRSELQKKVGAQLRKAIKDRKLKVADAARQLRISRQSLHAYMKGSASPNVEVLYRACALWGIEIVYAGYRFGAASFRGHEPKPEKKSRQLRLPLTLEDLHASDLQVQLVKKSATSVELLVKIGIIA